MAAALLLYLRRDRQLLIRRRIFFSGFGTGTQAFGHYTPVRCRLARLFISHQSKLLSICPSIHPANGVWASPTCLLARDSFPLVRLCVGLPRRGIYPLNPHINPSVILLLPLYFPCVCILLPGNPLHPLHRLVEDPCFVSYLHYWASASRRIFFLF